MADILERAGWAVSPMGYTKDGGIDIVAVRSLEFGVPIEMLVQCKRNKRTRKVGVGVVKELWATKWKQGAHQAMVATTSTFTRGAVKEASSWKMELRDHIAIFDWCCSVCKPSG